MDNHEKGIKQTYEIGQPSKAQTHAQANWADEIRKLEIDDIENVEDGVENSDEFENTINLGHTKSPRATWMDRKINHP